MQKLIEFKKVREMTSLSRATVWRYEKKGLFPRRRILTANRAAWLESEVLEWINARTIVL